MRLIYPLLSILVWSVSCHATAETVDTSNAAASASDVSDTTSGGTQTPETNTATGANDATQNQKADSGNPAIASDKPEPPLVGVGSCDQLLKNMSECAAKMPPEVNAGMQGTIGEMRQSFIERTKNKDINVGEMCTSMAGNTTNPAFSAAGCKF